MRTSLVSFRSMHRLIWPAAAALFDEVAPGIDTCPTCHRSVLAQRSGRSVEKKRLHL